MASFSTEFDPTLEGSLPPDFHWGFATAAAQIEGAWNRDGRGPSIWDTFCHSGGNIKDNTTVDDACMSYDLIEEDVARMKSYGINAYRFSLSWSRIIPLGGKDDPVNEAGIAYYSKLVDRLLENGITPFLTLYHWDLPESLYRRYGGMLNKARYTLDFMRYARVCFESFGDRVKYWITYNEPVLSARAGYAEGRHAPGHTSATEVWIVGHTEIVSHARVCAMYKQEFQPTQKGHIMITLSGDWCEPWDQDDPLDLEATKRAMDFDIGWFADPLYGKGECDYPASMRAQLGDRLPCFTAEEQRLIRGSSEFYGMNSYTSHFIKHRDGPPEENDAKGNIVRMDTNKDGKERGTESDTPWLRTAPWGWAKLLRWIWDRYQLPIYITENGTTAKGELGWRPNSNDDILEDPHRIDYYKSYVAEVAKASQEGIVIKSYLAWSLLDNFEWALGYTARFGVTWVDFEDPKRTRYTKRSALFLGEIFRHLIAQKR
ncbi:uncharacterized protein E0L32_007605 [Thyridium curvatum]|uniref:beta-glucosidase n=1 Tax=Thyridium curvatum TaxID=1093900 RepID=A0A507AXZ6_9PEZI|nr:uncharacterized protein E0L32_007605 [Thyridium curvatum]TPX11626.1 hypothetical protein E0L32_007605 [Thyridium curvatum]